MIRSRTLGLGAMVALLIVVVMALPLVIRFITVMEPHFVAGFQDMHGSQAQAEAQVQTQVQVQAQGQVQSVPSVPQLPSWRPDPNTDYMCRSPNGSDQPCPEGSFCDGASQSCISKYVGGDVPSAGYYS